MMVKKNAADTRKNQNQRGRTQNDAPLPQDFCQTSTGHIHPAQPISFAKIAMISADYDRQEKHPTHANLSYVQVIRNEM
jgi:hypothetical protein